MSLEKDQETKILKELFQLCARGWVDVTALTGFSGERNTHSHPHPDTHHPGGSGMPWTRGDAGRCGAHPGTHRLAMPALRTAVEMALMAVQRALRSCVNSPLPLARLPSSITKRVMVMTLVSKVERSVMVPATAAAATGTATSLGGAGRAGAGRGGDSPAPPAAPPQGSGKAGEA